ncbi:MAG: DoxX family membrane protein [Patescibacteria group bacterium]
MDTLFSKLTLTLTRVSLGWLMFYAGITKVMNPDWSAAFYLKDAKTFGGFYEWILNSSALPVVNFINAWGLTLLGISLIVGLGVRLSSILGAVLMLLYYFPILSFPMVGEYSYIVDDHIIYALVLVFFAAVRAGRVWGLDSVHKIKWFG